MSLTLASKLTWIESASGGKLERYSLEEFFVFFMGEQSCDL